MKWAGIGALMEERRGECRDLIYRPDEKRPLGRHRLSERIILK